MPDDRDHCPGCRGYTADFRDTCRGVPAVISTCCDAPVIVRGDTTQYWVCRACGKSCDARPGPVPENEQPR